MNRPEIGGILNHLINEFAMDLEGVDAKILFQENFDNHEKGLKMLQDNAANFEVIPDLGVQKGMLYYYRLFRWLIEYFKKEKPDIVVTHSPLPGYIGRLAANRAKVPRLVHIFHGHYFHSYFSRTKTEMLRRLEQVLAKKTSQILTISEEMKRALTEDYGITSPEKIDVMPIHINLAPYIKTEMSKKDEIRKKWGFKKDDNIYISVGRLAPIKNQKLFIDLLAYTKSQGVSVKGILVGKGESESELKSYAQSLEILDVCLDGIDADKDLSFAGERTDINELLWLSDLFVLTSLNEGTPLTLLEAQAAGLPILSTDVGGVRGIVDVKNTARLNATNDVVGMYKNAMDLGKCSPELLKYRQKKIVDRFDLSQKKKKVQKFYTRLTERPSHRDTPASF